MQNALLLLLIVVWTGGTLLRIYKQARFYQIEEYMNVRYLRWWLAKRERWVPNRPFWVTFVGCVLAFFLSESPGSILPVIIGIVATLVAVYPPDEGEIKKAFRRTERATRLLVTSSLVAIIVFVILTTLISNLKFDDIELNVVALMLVGLIGFLGAPLWLIAGNILMTPVEGFLRQRFINSARRVMANTQPTVIGITGSYGKTTTKNFITDILNGRYRAYATPKSYNTMMGVCIAINNDLATNYSVDYFVVEMGAYIRGEIERISELTPPAISVVVEVGPQHLERFGSLENIALAKYEIIKALPPDGLGVFNWDNPYVREMYERGYPDNRLAVSRIADPKNAPVNGPRFIATDITETLDGLSFTIHDTQNGEQETFRTAVIGEHNVTNILLAVAVAHHEGINLKDIAFQVRMLKPAESRLVRQTTAQGITIINDAYSANPAGIVSALKVLSMHTGGKRLLITPGMVELGELHETENRKLGQIAANHATDIILVGEDQTRPIKAGLQDAHFPEASVQIVDTLGEAVTWYESHLKSGDTVLFLNDLPDTY
ncbi:MAG: UDP-N-acetylmuramoyl-tripeptide--D-alanyl-D-alanine ligase [Aggregatilineales bacterium]